MQYSNKKKVENTKKNNNFGLNTFYPFNLSRVLCFASLHSKFNILSFKFIKRNK